ncbi:hypothetical protein FOZ63_010793 [Perkinsus olseni]|uniref:Uncharacterized protein n=2 Tax=Perkinsus olseni TaxID=32597 RepID=A0A7J6QU89_PEROL|nr:hypothetical protein FOZ63_010793 [Perkinsus olseni]
MAASSLLAVYKTFTGGDTLMDGRQFSKFCRSCQLIDDQALTLNDIDIVFAKVRFRGERKIEFGQLIEALAEIADRLHQPVSWVEERVLHFNEQVTQGRAATAATSRPFTKLRTHGSPSVAEALPFAKSMPDASSVEKHERGPERFFYDQSTYTGVWRHGGPKTYDGDHLNLKTMNRTAAPPPRPRAMSAYGSTTGTMVHSKADRIVARSRPGSALSTPRGGTNGSRPSDEGRENRKICLTPDTAWSKSTDASTGASDCRVRGPERFYYDTSTYTGVHKAGGPEVVDDRTKELKNLVKRRTTTVALAGSEEDGENGAQTSARSSRRKTASATKPETAALAAAERPDLLKVLSAVARGDIETVEEEVSNEASLGGVRGVYNSRGQSCMHVAAAYGSTEVIEWLSDSGCNPSEALAQVGLTPLHIAVLNGRPDTVRVRIQNLLGYSSS